MQAMPSAPNDSERIQRLRERISQFPKTPGVYLMKDAQGRVLYVGKAKDLRSRVASYFQDSADLLNTRGPDIARMAAHVVDIDFLECETEVDALLQESRLIKDIQPPHNVQLKDDKTFPYIEITTGDAYPGVYVTRKPRLQGSKLFGPFVAASTLRDAVNALQRVFKFRTCELDIREDDDKKRFFRPCLLYSINQCTGPCGDRISRADYRKDVERFRRFMTSKRSVLLREMEKEMSAAAAAMDFEEAARIRDRIKAIQNLRLSGDPDLDVQPEVFYVDPREALERLTAVLELEQPPRIIEGIDIANLQGEESVGALVCFVDGKAFKTGYRRYRIQTVQGQDDYAMIGEVVRRRYRRAAEGEELYPDVILIDGGLGQLHAALGACGEMFVRPPMVVSLAKRQEELYTQARKRPLRLPRNDPALRLLQQVRDEAHRFAQHYHHILRRRRQFDEDVKAARRPPRRSSRGRSANEGGGRQTPAPTSDEPDAPRSDAADETQQHPPIE